MLLCFTKYLNLKKIIETFFLRSTRNKFDVVSFKIQDYMLNKAEQKKYSFIKAMN